MNKVFLGGTCADTDWRDELIPFLKVDYFNPVVDDWTPDCIDEEDRQKNHFCNVHLYVITSDMKGVYSIAEVMDSASNHKGVVTILNVMPKGFSEGELKSLKATCKLVRENGGIAYVDDYLFRTVRLINQGFMGAV